MVCGTASDVGKSQVVAGLCRLLARRGVRVAPFKAQNMALNSLVCPSGHEISRAQGVQALAAGVTPEVAMNPVLLKPTGERTSQLVVLGRPEAHLDAAAYQEEKPRLLGVVLEALASLRARFDVVVCEGAGSPAEINLDDIVNLTVAAAAGLPALIVGDIDRGGVFAALHGTVALLPPEHRGLVRGFIINKLRGDPALLGPGLAELEARSGVPTLGVIPHAPGLHLDAEDSLALEGPRPVPVGPPLADGLDVAAIRLPRLANFTDLDPLSLEPGLSVRLVADPAALGDPDLVILPGSKATVADLTWLCDQGLDVALRRARDRGTVVLGVCGGYQMLGRAIVDEVESGRGKVGGLGWLDVVTTFGPDKLTRLRRGRAWVGGQPRLVTGYEIRHGRPEAGPGASPWLELSDDVGVGPEGAVDGDGGVLGTNLHGLFEEDRFRASFLAHVGRRRGRRFRPAGVSFAAARAAQADRLADLVATHLDLSRVEAVIAEGAP